MNNPLPGVGNPGGSSIILRSEILGTARTAADGSNENMLTALFEGQRTSAVTLEISLLSIKNIMSTEQCKILGGGGGGG